MIDRIANWVSLYFTSLIFGTGKFSDLIPSPENLRGLADWAGEDNNLSRLIRWMAEHDLYDNEVQDEIRFRLIKYLLERRNEYLQTLPEDQRNALTF